jgi:hypothetical protein
MTAPQTVPAAATSLGSRFLRFAIATTAITAVAGWLLSLIFTGPLDGAAILVSGVLAVSIQVAAFPIIRQLSARHLTAGWAVGSVVRLGTLVAYALLAPNVLLLPSLSALVSLAVFYFLSMVIEPLFFRS